jgi:hypothetical protein
MIRSLLADGHGAVRDARRRIRATELVEVCAEASNGREAVALAAFRRQTLRSLSL